MYSYTHVARKNFLSLQHLQVYLALNEYDGVNDLIVTYLITFTLLAHV